MPTSDPVPETAITPATHPFAFEVRSVIQRALEGLSPSAYSLSWEVVRDEPFDWVVIRLEPKNGRACPVAVNAPEGDDVITIEIGLHSLIEMALREPWSPNEDFPDPVDEFVAIVRAVIEGRVRETVWEKNGKINESEGTIEVGGRPRHLQHSGGYLPGKRLKREIAYEPYS